MKYFLLSLFALLLSFSFAPHAIAALSPVGLSIVPPLQFPPSEYDITGLRVSAIYGQHREMYGIDLGLVGNITEQEFTGLALSGVFNMTNGETHILGLQAAGITNINYNKVTVVGLQIAAGMNVNTAESTVYGLQAALLANLSEHTTINGVQFGLYNKAQKVRGFQIGLINDAVSLSGLQIGLLNIHRQGLFYMSPIINFGF